MLQSEFISEVEVEQPGLLAAEVSVGVGQSTDLRDSELHGPEDRVYVRRPQQLQRQVLATHLGEQHLESPVAVLPAELENVPDQLLHQLEGLLNLRLGQRSEVDHSDVHLWFGDEGASRNSEAAVNGAEVLSHDGETTPLSAACAGGQPLGDFLLESECEPSATVGERSCSVGDAL